MTRATNPGIPRAESAQRRGTRPARDHRGPARRGSSRSTHDEMRTHTYRRVAEEAQQGLQRAQNTLVASEASMHASIQSSSKQEEYVPWLPSPCATQTRFPHRSRAETQMWTPNGRVRLNKRHGMGCIQAAVQVRQRTPQDRRRRFPRQTQAWTSDHRCPTRVAETGCLVRVKMQI